MEPRSEPDRRGRVPWQRHLLAVSLLTFWNMPATAQLTIVTTNATEGKDVLLLVHNLPVNIAGYVWYKGASVDGNRIIASYVIDSQESIPGPAHSGRETIYANGSLLFEDVTLEDTGYYTLQAIRKNFQNEEVTGQLRIYPELPTPNVTSNNSDPVENKDPVALTCDPETQNTTYLWLINRQSLVDSARMELSEDNRTLTFLRVTRDDTGPYECVIWNPASASRSDPLYLNVLYGPETPTISPSNPRYRPGENLSLSCHAASNPPAQYSWLINGRPQQPTQELFIPNITVNDSGSYTCLVHNSVTGLNRTTVKIVTVSGACVGAAWVACPQLETLYHQLTPEPPSARLRGNGKRASHGAGSSELCPGSDVTSPITLCDTSLCDIPKENSECWRMLEKYIDSPMKSLHGTGPVPKFIVYRED